MIANGKLSQFIKLFPSVAIGKGSNQFGRLYEFELLYFILGFILVAAGLFLLIFGLTIGSRNPLGYLLAITPPAIAIMVYIKRKSAKNSKIEALNSSLTQQLEGLSEQGFQPQFVIQGTVPEWCNFWGAFDLSRQEAALIYPDKIIRHQLEQIDEYFVTEGARALGSSNPLNYQLVIGFFNPDISEKGQRASYKFVFRNEGEAKKWDMVLKEKLGSRPSIS